VQDPVQLLVGQQIVQLCRAHRATAQGLLAELGLHPGQEMVLMLLWHQDGQPQSHLAQHLGVAAPTVSKMLDRLEQAQILERHASSLDNRVSLVYLTPKGKQLEPQVAAVWQELEQRTTEHLTPVEVSQFQGILKKVLLSLRHGNMADGCEPTSHNS
jgi:MarR family transcriptional regulator, organic hydroperoxide resistance regulator